MEDSMRKSRLSWYKQERLIEHFISGSTARCAAELIGVNKSTAAYYFQRLAKDSGLSMRAGIS
jgi:transposase